MSLEVGIAECIKQLEYYENKENDKASLAKRYAEIYRLRNQEIDTYVSELRQAKPKLSIYLAALLGPIIVQLYESAVKNLVSYPDLSSMISNIHI